MNSSKFKSLVQKVFVSTERFVIGAHPHTRFCHPQQSVNRNLNRLVYRKFIQASEVCGVERVLDIGCGEKPYSFYLPNVFWFGIDVVPGRRVDQLVTEAGAWELKDNFFDAVICTEVLEHAVDPAVLMQEMFRVMKPGALALISTPFIYCVHGEPNDFRRYTEYGLKLESRRFQIIESGMIGGVGSALAITVNNWLMSMLQPPMAIKILTAPLIWGLYALVNATGRLLDCVDQTNRFGTNSWVLLRKP